MQGDLEVIPFADIARFVLCLSKIDGLLKARQVLLGKLESGFSQQDGYELLRHIKGERALIIRDLRTGNLCLVLRSLQTALPFVSPLEEISNAKVKLLVLIEILEAEILRGKDGNILRIKTKGRVGAQVGGDFLRLVLRNQGAFGQQSVIVCKRKIDRLLERDIYRGLPFRLGSRQQQGHSRNDAPADARTARRP